MSNLQDVIGAAVILDQKCLNLSVKNVKATRGSNTSEATRIVHYCVSKCCRTLLL